MIQTAQNHLKSVFGYDEFRPQQEEIVENVLSKKDSIVLMPTGGGKSICFQIPALCFEGTALVISPLISLMKDQVEALKSNGVSAAFFNSSQSDFEKQQIINQAQEGTLKLLYMAPETLLNVLNTWLTRVEVSMVAIDEAHCVSMWGHDFRPEYTQLSQLRDYWSEVPYIALTATADKATRKEIKSKLGLVDPNVFLTSFDRPNISLEVRGNLPKKDKRKDVLDFIQSRQGESGIIYCLSRRETEEWSEFLLENGIPASHYHAGLTSEERAEVQEDFINDRVPIVTATIAFGMGIDKSNVRWIIHNNLPKNIEGYYQEIGRAGRDGLPSQALLYYNMRDVKLLADFAQDSPHKDVLVEKLNRMLQFAESPTCRRKTLLSYFGETLIKDCGNCDVCENPPAFISGSLIAQKALSGIMRTNEKIGMNLLIQVLRGSKSFEVYDKGFNKLKTYGVGADLSAKEWQHYLTQLLNQGVVEIAYDENFNLKVTSFGKRILFDGQKLMLSSYVEQSNKKDVSKSKRKSKRGTSDEQLFERLRNLRLQMAKKEKVPAYIVFSDATLKDMVEKKPILSTELTSVSGVGHQKMIKYGEEFAKCIKDFLDQNPKKKSTFDVTLDYLNEGFSVSETALARDIQETTIFSHIAKLYTDNKLNDINKYFSSEELSSVEKAIQKLGETEGLKPIFEELNGEVPYGVIRLCISYFSKNELAV
ncbi:MAG: DNA helicase RecQ [Fluviicola sp.]|nr:MAG: DNA helicase RecQ [Fluviicola sp.]